MLRPTDSGLPHNWDVTAPDKAAAAWEAPGGDRHRSPRWEKTSLPRTGKHGAALRAPPPGDNPHVNMAWMWGALLAANMGGRLGWHPLTALPRGQDILAVRWSAAARP